MFLNDAIKYNVERKFKTCFLFLRDCLGEVGRKLVWFLFVLCFLAATKKLFKTNEKIEYKLFTCLLQYTINKVDFGLLAKNYNLRFLAV